MGRAVSVAGCFLIFGCSFLVTTAGLRGDAGDVVDAADATDAGHDVMDVAMDTRSPECPSARGPKMVRVDDRCIDSIEVTVQHYLDFLKDTDGGADRPADCQWKTSFAPGGTQNDPTLPVTDVDWCDAWAYCEWAGKELCGGMDGGAIAPSAANDPRTSFWMKACTKDGAQPFPYGATFDINACNMGKPDGGNGAAVKAQTFAKCEGGYPGIFDIVGNVREWENACADAGRTGACKRRGGAPFDRGAPSGCANDSPQPRDFRSFASGIRCCAPVR